MARHGFIGFFPLLACAVALADDWPQWRGPGRDGISAETGLLAAWPAGGPRLVWKARGIGSGYSSFAVVGTRLFTQGQQGSQEFVLAIDINTGNTLWKTFTGRSFANDKGGGPRGTPTVDGPRLYAISADGVLVCLDSETGKRIWEVSLTERFGGRLPNRGYCESPLVEGDRLLVTPGGSGAAVVALDKATGEPRWKSQNDRAGYSSIVAFDAGGARRLAVFTAEAALGLDAKDGELLWRYGKVANPTANIATPIVHDGQVFFSSDYGTGCVLLKLTPTGRSVEAAEVYFNREMRNHYCTSVLVGDYLYGFSSTILTAMKFSTGEVAWRNRSVGKGSLIYADRRLYVMGEDGMAGLIDPSPAAYREISRFEIPHGDLNTWTPPVVANGRLYLRDQDTLYCYDIKRPNP